MNRGTIDIIEKTIHKDYWLNRQDRDWLLDNNVKLRAPNRHSVGFSLDNGKNLPLAFFGGDPPEHIAKMCDAIVALLYDNKLYLFIVEQKTANSGQYRRQLANGKLFCDWLFSLYKQHGYCDDEPVYVGLFIWKPRRTPAKQGTFHPPVKSEKHELFACFFEEQNKLDIYLDALVNACRKQKNRKQ